jgi:uncharacterized repeat protein (TIGR02543 family)
MVMLFACTKPDTKPNPTPDPTKYTLTFEENGGSAVQDASIEEGKTATLPTDLTKTGYTFGGWFVEDDGDTAKGAEFTNETAVTGDTTVYAKWTVNALTFALSKGVQSDATGEPTLSGANYGAEVTLPAATAFAKTGYTLTSWTIGENETVRLPGTAIAATTANGFSASGATTITAQWAAIPYALTLNANGGVYENDYTAPSTYTIESVLITLPTSDDIAKTGYTFGGWYEDGDDFTGEPVLTVPAASTGAKTYFAKWTANTYTVAYSGNLPSGASGSVSGTMEAQSFVYDEEQALTTNGFTLTGYTFAGWATSASGAVAYANIESVQNLSSTDNDTVTLYAVWTANTYKVKFVKLLDTRWYTQEVVGSVQGTMADQTFTFDVEQALTPNAYTLTGYTFLGWASSGGTVQHLDGAIVKNVRTTGSGTENRYAKWLENSLSFSFANGGGEGENPTQTALNYGENITLPANPYTKAGYTFAGWRIGENETLRQAGSIQLVTTNGFNESGSTTITAVWYQAYTVSFVVNGGTAIDPIQTNIDGKITLPTPDARTGYRFVGWYKEVGLTTSVNNNTVYEAAQTLYAKWEVSISAGNYVIDGGYSKGGVLLEVVDSGSYKTLTVYYRGTAATPQNASYYNAANIKADGVVYVTGRIQVDGNGVVTLTNATSNKTAEWDQFFSSGGYLNYIKDGSRGYSNALTTGNANMNTIVASLVGVRTGTDIIATTYVDGQFVIGGEYNTLAGTTTYTA